MRRFAACLIAALLFGSAGAATAAKHFMWRISDGSHKLYLVGSVHVLRAQDYPLPPELEQAYASSDGLVEEIDLSQFDPMSLQVQMTDRGSLPPGQTLKDVVPQGLYLELTAEAKRRGVDMDLLDGMRPWMASIVMEDLLLRHAGLDPALGVDIHFSNEAQAVHKPVTGLELPEDQIGMLADLPETAQEEMLRQSLHEDTTSDPALQEMLTAWHQGDASTLEKVMLRELSGYPAVYQPMLVQRNRKWVPKLEALLKSGKQYFVVVGALHLVGPDGLLANLRKDGYKVEQL